MLKFTAPIVVLAALAGAASAQSYDTKIESPFRAEVGAYLPTFSDGGKNVGASVGVGYSFLKRGAFDLAAVGRYTYFQGHLGPFDYDASLGTYGLDLRWQPEGQKFFVGVGLAAADIQLDLEGGSGNVTKLGYSVEAGYDFSKKLYGVVRFQDTTDDRVKVYKGVTVGVGVRF